MVDASIKLLGMTGLEDAAFLVTAYLASLEGLGAGEVGTEHHEVQSASVLLNLQEVPDHSTQHKTIDRVDVDRANWLLKWYRDNRAGREHLSRSPCDIQLRESGIMLNEEQKFILTRGWALSRTKQGGDPKYWAAAMKFHNYNLASIFPNLDKLGEVRSLTLKLKQHLDRYGTRNAGSLRLAVRDALATACIKEVAKLWSKGPHGRGQQPLYHRDSAAADRTAHYVLPVNIQSENRNSSSDVGSDKITKNTGERKHDWTHARDALVELRESAANYRKSLAPIIEKAGSIRYHAEGGEVRIRPLRRVAAWAWVIFALSLAAYVVVNNTAQRENMYERLGDGVQVITVLLVSIFGLVKLTSEDDNAIRNVILGRKILRNPSDVSKYLKVEWKDIYLAIVTAEEEIPWLEDHNICCSTVRATGNIRVPETPTVGDLVKIGIVPVGAVVYDVITGEMMTYSTRASGTVLYSQGGHFAHGDEIEESRRVG